MEVTELLLIDAADWLEKNRNTIIGEASSKIYRAIDSYKAGRLPLEESKGTMNLVLSHIIDFLRDKEVSIDQKHSFLQTDLIKFEDGIASKRVVYEIELEDLLRGIRIFRDEIWNYLGERLDGTNLSASEFLCLEQRINVFIYFLMSRVASSYNRTMAEVIGNQAKDLEKWEEVIKSASNIELKIPCRGEFAAIVRLQAEAIARRLKYTEEEIQDIKVAVGEACDNAIEHGVSDKGIDIHYHLSLEELRIEIIDYGCGFDPSGRGQEPPDPFAERGRGIFLMKALMDKAEIYSRPGEGTMQVLVKKRIFR